MSEAYIIDAVRTPRGIGKVGKGALAYMHPHHVADGDEGPSGAQQDPDTRTWTTSSGEQAGLANRAPWGVCVADAGYDVHSSGVTLDRFCGAGIPRPPALRPLRSGQEWRISSLPVAPRDDVAHCCDEPSRRRPASSGRRGDGGDNLRLQRRHPQSHQGLAADAIASMEGFTVNSLTRSAWSVSSAPR